MPPRKKNNNSAELAIGDYRHKDAKRKNIPPAKIAAEGVVPTVPPIKYEYTPRRSPELRFDPQAGPDKLPKLLAKARHRALTEAEVQQLAAALRTQEPCLEWAGKLEQNRRGLSVDPVALHIHERVSAHPRTAMFGN
jgi:adenine-specific DNA-methyltransferase